MATKVSNCGHDENYRARGGKAGDQTGSEYYVRDWYSFGQNVVLRYPDGAVAAQIAELATQAANNNAIGYDQNERLTFYNRLKAAGWHPEAIKAACEADCSSSTAAIVIAAGHLMGIEAFTAVSPSSWTGNLRAQLVAAGFKALTASTYTGSGDYLLAGDINLNEATHVNITVSNGIYSGGTVPDKGKLEIDGYIGPKSVSEWQRQLGTYVDGVISGQDKVNRKYMERLTSVTWDEDGSPMVKAMQALVGTPTDGIIGPKTVKRLQTWLNRRDSLAERLAADGYFGPNTAKALQRSLNAGEWRR